MCIRLHLKDRQEHVKYLQPCSLRRHINRGTALAFGSGMECYFGSQELPEASRDSKSAVVAFHIPEIGIRFKAPFDGADDDHSDFASLLALLEFIDSNQKYFSNHTYQIYGNNIKTVNQVNGRENPPAHFAPLMEKAKGFQKKYRFSLEWIPSDDNTAFDPLLD